MSKIKSTFIPTPRIIEQTAGGERHYDIFSRLLLDRIVFIGTEIFDTVTNVIVAQMLFLEQDDSKAPIHLYINSPGGNVYAGLGIYDIMQYVSCPIHTYCVGLSASMGSLLLTAGTKGHRYCLPHGRIMIHQPLGGFKGQCSDIQIQANEIQHLKNRLTDLYVEHCSQKISRKKMEESMDRDRFLNPQEAIDMGLIDGIVSKNDN